MTWDMGWAAWPGSGSKISPFSPCQEDSKGASMEDVDDDDDDALKAQRRVLEGPGRSWRVLEGSEIRVALLDVAGSSTVPTAGDSWDVADGTFFIPHGSPACEPNQERLG